MIEKLRRSCLGNLPIGHPWLLVLLAIGAAIWLYFLTGHGIGIGNDSVVYLAGARNIHAGQGFVWIAGDGSADPINHYPPVFSLFLATGYLLPGSEAQFARWLQVVLLGLNTFCLGMLVRAFNPRSHLYLGAALIFAISAETLGVHSWSMSDSLFLLWVLSFFIGLLHWRRSTQAPAALACVSLLAGLASLTRYIGVVLIAVLMLVLLLDPSVGLKRRVQRLLYPLLLAGIPLGAWLIRNQRLAGSMTNRVAGWFPHPLSWWSEMPDAILAWFVPGRILAWLADHQAVLFLTVALGVAIGVWLLWARHGVRGLDPRTWRGKDGLVLLLFIGLYLAFILASAWLSYPDPDINDRTLFPVYAALLAVVFGGLSARWSRFNPAAKAGIGLGLLLLVGDKVYAARYIVRQLVNDGQGYSSVAWQESETIHALARLQPKTIYTDNLGAVYYFTGQPAMNIPLRYDSITHAVRADYDAAYHRMLAGLEAPGAVLVLFNDSARLPEFPEPGLLTAGLQLVGAYDDGSVYRLERSEVQ